MDVIARLDVGRGEPNDLPVAPDRRPASDAMERDLVSLRNFLAGLERRRAVLERLSGAYEPPRDPDVIRWVEPERDLFDPFGDHDRPPLGHSRRSVKREKTTR